jgi:3D (Asp-Asp-Asp) domain-containing protein
MKLQKEQIYHYLVLVFFVGLLAFFVNMCKKGLEEDQVEQESSFKEMQVTATAYNSTKEQTYGHPAEAAWGDTLKPGMKVIAVSRDLLDSGLTYGTRVHIEGLPGQYVVLDKMNARWKKKIDIYMGTSRRDAREWGKKEVTIRWKADQ